MKSRLTLILLVIILGPGFFAQSQAGDWSTDPAHWGIGFINFDPEASPNHHLAHGLCLPQGVGLPLYAAAHREQLLGFLFGEKPDNPNQDTHLHFFSVQGGSTSVSGHVKRIDARRITYEQTFLLYTDDQDGFVRILPSIIPGGAWIAKADLEAQGFIPETWKAFLHRSSDTFTFYPPERFALNLRAQPDPAAEKLIPLRKDIFRTTLTGNFKGLWAEVSVEEFTDHECAEGVPTGRKWTGWLKLLDDQGFPNIWYYPGGC